MDDMAHDLKMSNINNTDTGRLTFMRFTRLVVNFNVV